MGAELEPDLRLTESETRAAQHILSRLNHYLVKEWTVVGGLAIRYLFAKHRRAWNYPFNDLDIISPTESVLATSASEEFDILHHHRAPETFYFQLTNNEFPWIRIDIFQDVVGEETQTINFLGQEVRIPIPEEIYLFKLRDILLLLNHPRGLPPKHVEEFRFLETIVNLRKVRSLWEQRHLSPPRIDRRIYEFKSFDELTQEVERELEEKAENIKEWEKSDPLVACDECLKDSPFPLLRDSRES